MGSTRDFITATLADAVAPSFRRPVEDIIYETLDRRQIPTRTDFKELRDIINNLRSQSSGATNGIKKLKEGLDELEESVCEMGTQIVDLTMTVQILKKNNENLLDSMETVLNRLSALEKGQSTNSTSSTPAPKKNTATATCQVEGCNAPQRAWGFCAPHYAKWRRGTLKGFVRYDGTVTIDGASIDLSDHKGKAFQVKGTEIWIDGECVSKT